MPNNRCTGLVHDCSNSIANALELLQSCTKQSNCSYMYNRLVNLIRYTSMFSAEDHHINSSPPSASYMCQWTGSSLVQVMAGRLIGAKPLSKPILGYCQLDPLQQISIKFDSIYKTFHSRKCIWKYHLPKWQPFSPKGDKLRWLMPKGLCHHIFPSRWRFCPECLSFLSLALQPMRYTSSPNTSSFR